MEELAYPADVRVETEDLRAETDISGFNPMDGLEEEPQVEEQSIEQEEAPQPPPQTTGLPPQRDLGNPHARARIAARDARLYKQRFEQLWNWVQQQSQTSQQEQPEIPPYEEAPLDHLQAKTQILEKQLQEKQLLEQKQREDAYIMDTLSQGGSAIQEFSKASNGVYEKAVQHVANVRLNDMLESNPNLTLPEAERYLALEAQRKIFEWTRMGLHPAMQFMDEAVRLGFNWQAYDQGSTQTMQFQGDDSARREIQAQRKKDNAARTISSMPGKSPKRPLQNRDPLKMQDDEFNNVLKILESERGGPRKARITMQDFFQAQS